MDRDDIHLISRYSNWSEKGVEHELVKHIYATPQAWRKFLNILLISIGAGFTIAGIVFFFAYNWSGLHKFIKIGMVEGGILVLTLFVLSSKFNQEIKNIFLTGTSVLVGVLFAVYGQIYQTGANAYDFFLGWTIFISLWVIVANYAPLWLIYLTLINTTFILYSQQVAHDWSTVLIFTLLFLLNISFLAISLYCAETKRAFKVPGWFTKSVALASVTFSTIGISLGIHGQFESSFVILQLATIALYAAGLKYGLTIKSRFYLSIIPFSMIIILTSLLIKISEDEAMWLFVSVFVIVSVTMVIRFLTGIQKKWDHE